MKKSGNRKLVLCNIELVEICDTGAQDGGNGIAGLLEAVVANELALEIDFEMGIASEAALGRRGEKLQDVLDDGLSCLCARDLPLF